MTTLKRLITYILVCFLSVSGILKAATLNVPGSYATISAAITAAAPSGDVILVAPGNYTENIVINKELTLMSTGDVYNTAILGPGGTAITITANNVTIDGFTIQNSGGKAAIYSQDKSNIIIKNNLIHNIGNTDASLTGTNFGIGIVSSASAVNSVTITNNRITYIIGGNFKSAAAIAIGWSTGTFNITNLVISDNDISYVRSSILAYASGGRGAYGVMINHGTAGGQTVSALIQNNNIEDLEGLWSHGIGMEGNTPGASILANRINKLVDHKSPADPDAAAIEVEDNPSAASLTITGNSFTNVLLGLRNTTAFAVNAAGNWWGDLNPADNILNTNPGGSIVYSPALPGDIAAVVLGYPFNNSNGHPLKPRLEWNSFSGAAGYEIVLDDNANFASPLVYTTNASFLYLDVPVDLSNNTTYYWRVRGINAGTPAYSAWSDVWHFTTTTSGRSGIAYPILSYPLNDSTVYVSDPILAWYMSTSQVGITLFELEYKSGNSDFSTGTITAATSTGLFKQIQGLISSTNYYWRVRAYNGGLNLYSAWSDIFHFVSNPVIPGVPSTPVPSYPKNVIVYHDDTPLLHWYVTNFDLDFRFDVVVDRVDPGPSYINVFAGSTSSSQQFIECTTQLESGKEYRWRVRTTKAGFPASSWSDYAYFTMDQYSLGAPVQPTAIYPANNAVVYSMTPQLHWYITSYVPGVEWRIQVKGVSPAVSGYNEIFTSTSYQYYFNWPTALTAGENYRWRVRSRRAGYDASDWSDWAEFSIYQYVNGTPVKPTPIWPVNDFNVFVNPPLLSWYVNNYTPGAEYEIELKPLATPFNGAGTILTGSYQQFYQLTNQLATATLYHWRVRTRTVTLTSQWSDGATFKIDANYALGNSLPQPQLVYPIGVPVYTTQPILSWYVNNIVGVTGYKIKIATDPALLSQIAGSPFTSTNLSYQVVSSLTPGTTYFWSVQSSDGIGLSIPSDPGQFTVVPGSSAPVVPQIGGPDGVSLQSTSASLNWYSSVETISGTTYELEYSTSKDFRNSSVIKNIEKPEYLVSNLKPGEEYYWRVRSTGINNETSEYSLSGSFQTSGVTDVVQSIVPDKFLVEQNYPNPFNPVTNINLKLPHSSVLTVKIYNVVGQEVRELINKQMNPGEYTLQWNGDNNAGQKMPSGTYICRVIAADNIQTIKMVLLK